MVNRNRPASCQRRERTVVSTVNAFIRINEPKKLENEGLPWNTYTKAQWAFRKRHENGLNGAFVRQGRNILVNVEAAKKLLAQQTAA
jgi:hypothetical protein